MSMYYTAEDILSYIENAAIKKVNRPTWQLFLLAIFAGAFIAFGATGSFLVSGVLYKSDVGLSKLVSGIVFPVGLMMVILTSLELFTSNCLMMVGVLSKKIKSSDMIKVLSIVFIGNFIGALIVSYLNFKTHSIYQDAVDMIIKVAISKVSANGLDIFLKAILCNVVVCIGAISAYCAKDWPGKIFAVWFSIMLFVVLGYDHCIANMMYIPTAIFYGAEISVYQFLYNLFFATLGNFVGGAFVVGAGYYYTQKAK